MPRRPGRTLAPVHRRDRGDAQPASATRHRRHPQAHRLPRQQHPRAHVSRVPGGSAGRAPCGIRSDDWHGGELHVDVLRRHVLRRHQRRHRSSAGSPCVDRVRSRGFRGGPVARRGTRSRGAPVARPTGSSDSRPHCQRRQELDTPGANRRARRMRIVRSRGGHPAARGCDRRRPAGTGNAGSCAAREGVPEESARALRRERPRHPRRRQGVRIAAPVTAARRSRRAGDRPLVEARSRMPDGHRRTARHLRGTAGAGGRDDDRAAAARGAAPGRWSTGCRRP